MLYPGPTPHSPAAHLHLGLEEAYFLLQLLVFLLQPLHTVQIFPTVQGLDQGRDSRQEIKRDERKGLLRNQVPKAQRLFSCEMRRKKGEK